MAERNNGDHDNGGKVTTPLKVLLYSHDTYGLGHFRRNLAISRRLLSATTSTQVIMATGSTVSDRFEKPDALRIVKLPPVTKTGVDEYDSWQARIPLSLVRRARSAVLVDVISRWKPDIFLVDHAPQGMKGELLPVFAALRAVSPRTRIILGLRDILDDPEHVRKVWSATGVYETMQDTYDKVLVYGQREILDIASAYSLPANLSGRITYCGYVSPPRPAQPVLPPGLTEGKSYILGTVGGGGDGIEILCATLTAAKSIGISAVLACGPLMPFEDRSKIERLAAQVPASITVELLDDLAGVALGASCVVSRGGYNTLSELVPLDVPIVAVPRTWPRKEQLIRARRFESLGLVSVVEPDVENFESAVCSAVEDAINRNRKPAMARAKLDMSGLARACQAIESAGADELVNI